ncbi:hypothetical protein FEI15_09815 [Lacticaseibacillus zeae]|uniref:Alpha-galactosidase n=1 Tax=Lacticaseibacillus zeae TaxID=57037 RepID=A0A5R8LNA4_LACZE|nr:hypothetical protein FEI15_09815 [Lacticaseibacillus zeae]TLF39863.1 hypothetical protein FEI14_12060 [Lacticaseibacillus zeae]
MTRSPVQGPAHKDLGRNGQDRAITPKAAYAPVPNRTGSRSLTYRRNTKWRRFSQSTQAVLP